MSLPSSPRTSPRLFAAAAVLVPLAAAACASSASSVGEGPPERPLFRLRTTGFAPVIDASVADDVPSGPPVDAWSAEFRIERPGGEPLASPRLVVYPAQLGDLRIAEQFSYIADFDVTRDGDDWVADPVIAIVASGVSIEMTVLDVEGRRDQAALGWRVFASDVRRPMAARPIGALSTKSAGEVSVQFPRCESVEVAGARRVGVGETFEMARIPDPAGRGELVVRGRIDRVTVPGPVAEAAAPAELADVGTEFAPAPDPRVAEDSSRAAGASLRELARAAASGSDSRSIRLSAVRLPPGVVGVEAKGVETLATLTVSSVIAPGVRGADLLREAYLADWTVDTTAREGVFDPVVKTHESGLSAEVARDGRLVVRWCTTPRWDRFLFAPGGSRSPNLTSAPPVIDPSVRLAVDAPESTSVERRVPLELGRSVHPVFLLPDGGTAALVVEFGPVR